MSNSDQARNYFLNIRKQNKANLAWRSRRLASRNLVRPLLQVRLASRKPDADSLSVSASQASLFTKRIIPTAERTWKIVPVNSSCGGALPTAISKMVTRLVRHQEERQSDAHIHWDTKRPIGLKAFSTREHKVSQTKTGFNVSIKEAGRRGSSAVRIPKMFLAYVRAIQGHSGGRTIAPELMKHTMIPYNWK